jgi:transcriptional regulator with PAS, ATPase and Fis domain
MDIEDSLEKGIFREDLYYRLSVIPIEVPPLRDRIEDVIPLTMHFLNKFSLYYKKEIKEIDENALDTLLSYDWPGNIRELENTLEYAFVRTINNDRIETKKLPPSLRDKIKNKSNGSSGNQKIIIDDNKEAAMILSLLNKHKWNKTKVAKELGVGRTTLWRKMNSYGLE